MKTVFLCASFYGLGVFNCVVFAAVYLLHRPRYTATTMRERRKAEVKPVAPESAQEDGVNYSFMGATGIEE